MKIASGRNHRFAQVGERCKRGRGNRDRKAENYDLNERNHSTLSPSSARSLSLPLSPSLSLPPSLSVYLSISQSPSQFLSLSFSLSVSFSLSLSLSGIKVQLTRQNELMNVADYRTGDINDNLKSRALF
eukprot:sb/3475231/